MKVCTNIQSEDCDLSIMKYRDTIMKVCTNIQSDDCDLSANREIPENNCEGSHCEIEINEGPDADTSNWKLHGSIHTWARRNKDSDDKCYDTIVSFMPGPDADTRNILMTNIMIQLSHSCKGPDAETVQPCITTHNCAHMWTPRGEPTPLTEASPHRPTPRKRLCIVTYNRQLP